MSLPSTCSEQDQRNDEDIFRNRFALKTPYLAHLYNLLKEHPNETAAEIIQRAEREFGKCPVTIRHFNRIRKEMGFSIRKGRPEGKKEKNGKDQIIKVDPNASFLGMPVFDDWVEQNKILGSAIESLQSKIESYQKEFPDADFPLLKHREETLIGRFKALLYAPIFGIKKLSEYDVKSHGLLSIVGRSYHSSTLTQYLCDLEKVDAGDDFVPTLLPEDPGIMLYIDGHMIPFWTSKSMHKGKITMLGRIMAGSQAVVTHNDNGRPLFFEYYPPDVHLNHIILDYCMKLEATTSIKVFIIDREVNSLEIARKFHGKSLGLLTMLDRNQYKDLSCFKTEQISEEGVEPKIYKGTWAEEKENDPRVFVILEKEDRLLVYWGTPVVEKVIEPILWPGIYSNRSEIQENSFKRMKEHGALDVNYGIKKNEVNDRHKEREINDLEKKLKKAKERVIKKEKDLIDQEKKVAESKEKKHKKRLEIREKNLELKKKPLKKGSSKKAN